MAAGACARYEMVPASRVRSLCPRPEPAAPERLDSLAHAPGEPVALGAVAGYVVGPGARPLPGAQVTIGGAGGRVLATDSAGRFEAAGFTSRRYEIAVRQIGLRTRRDTVALPLAVPVVIALATNTLTLDGFCSGIYFVRARKPWWKVW